VRYRPPHFKYQLVEADLRRFVEHLPIGTKLQGERELAVIYECSFLTVRKALKRLVGDGTIIRQMGRGTFTARQFQDASLAASKATRMGVLVFQGSYPYGYQVMQALAQASIIQNIELRSIWISDFGEQTLAQVDALKNDRCIAMLLPWFPHDLIEKVCKFVMRCSLPVSLPLIIPGLEKNCFEHPGIFNTSGTTIITEETCHYYHVLGHERIAFLGPDSANDPILQKKIIGYVHYTSRKNLANICGLVAPGAKAMDRLADRWKSYRRNLAIVCYDDQHALRFMTAMHKLGLHAPGDYCIVGHNDTESSRYSDPPLTTSQQNFDYVGHWLLKNAEALAHGRVSQSKKSPRLHFIVRNTCGGREKITDSFRAQFHNIDIAVDNSAVPVHILAPMPAPVAAVS
jgi:hypothetical protein